MSGCCALTHLLRFCVWLLHTHPSAALHSIQSPVQHAHQVARGHEAHEDVAGVQVGVDEVVQ